MVVSKVLKLNCMTFPKDNLRIDSSESFRFHIKIKEEDDREERSILLSEENVAKLRKFLNQNFDIDGKRKER